jgi:hypothetical protein
MVLNGLKNFIPAIFYSKINETDAQFQGWLTEMHLLHNQIWDGKKRKKGQLNYPSALICIKMN